MSKKNSFLNFIRGFFGVEYLEDKTSPPNEEFDSIIFREPSTFNDTQLLADDFKSGKMIILNLGEIEKELAKRIIDFSSGFVYVLDGKIKQIGEMLFIITPKKGNQEDKIT